MGRQIIKQPDGRYLIYSSIVEGIVARDLTADDVGDRFAAYAADVARRQAMLDIEQIEAGRSPYGSCATTYEEATAE